MAFREACLSPCVLVEIYPLQYKWPEFLCQQTGSSALRLQYGNGLGIERNKFFRPQPVTLMSDHTVRKISSGVQNGQPCLDCRSIHYHFGGFHKSMDCVGNIRDRSLVTATKHPHKFAKNWNRHSD